jgi:hypothetical protein
MTDDILNKLWRSHAPETVLDTSFVERVIKPAMEEHTIVCLNNLLSDLVDQKPETLGGGMLPIHRDIECVEHTIKLLGLQ